METNDPLDDLFEMEERDLLSLLDTYRRREKSLRARIEIVERVVKNRSAANKSPGLTPTQRQALQRGMAALAAVNSLSKPTMSARILEVMQSDPSKLWSADAILKGLVERGHSPQGQNARNTVAATLSRMNANGIVDRPASGYYVIPPVEEGRPSLLPEDGESG